MPPMISGSRARKLANTRVKMTSEPTDPIIASVMIPVPLAGFEPFASRSEPVTPTCHPAGPAAVTARSIAGPRSGPPKPLTVAV